MVGERIRVTVHPSASKDAVILRAPGQFEVWVTAPPVDGRASEAVGRLLASHLRVPPSTLRLVRGHQSRHKVFQLVRLTH